MIKFYGASDDLVEVSGCEGADEFNVYPKGDEIAWHGDLAGPGEVESLRVHLWYDNCWHVGVGQCDEEVPMPSWPLTIRQGRGLTDAARAGTEAPEPSYTSVLEVDAPEGTRLVNIWPAPEQD